MGWPLLQVPVGASVARFPGIVLLRILRGRCPAAVMVGLGLSQTLRRIPMVKQIAVTAVITLAVLASPPP